MRLVILEIGDSDLITKSSIELSFCSDLAVTFPELSHPEMELVLH